ncbi:MAG: hypothetical protein SVY15_08930 [Halobacteriota archaeon]|nr:hypothetical protein [Halobacteriota archaeon]
MGIQEKTEPLIVSIHEKGPSRGISIYIGAKEVDSLEKYGIDLKGERKYLVKPGRKQEMNLIPISSLDKEDENLNILFELVSRVEKLHELNREDKDQFFEEIISIIISNEVDVNCRERAAIMQFMKENYSTYILQSVIQVSLRADPEATLEVASRYTGRKKEEVV